MSFEKLLKADNDAVELVTPSKFKVTIRQQTGEDDDILSAPGGAFLGENLNKFVQGIILSWDLTKNKKPSYQDIENMKLRDKYFTIIASRIFSLGNIMKFTYEWPDNTAAEYEEDLLTYIWDYSLPDEEFPWKGHKLYNPARIEPHKYGIDSEMEFVLKSGKKFKFSFMNGIGERYLMTLPLNELSKNTELKARNLHQQVGDKWVKVESFKNYTAREMAEIRGHVFSNDHILEISVDIPHPHNGEVVPYMLLGSNDFLFPQEI